MCTTRHIARPEIEGRLARRVELDCFYRHQFSCADQRRRQLNDNLPGTVRGQVGEDPGINPSGCPFPFPRAIRFESMLNPFYEEQATVICIVEKYHTAAIFLGNDV